MYKYLGIELRSGLSFKHYKDKIVAEARKRMLVGNGDERRRSIRRGGLHSSVASISQTCWSMER